MITCIFASGSDNVFVVTGDGGEVAASQEHLRQAEIALVHVILFLVCDILRLSIGTFYQTDTYTLGDQLLSIFMAAIKIRLHNCPNHIVALVHMQRDVYRPLSIE